MQAAVMIHRMLLEEVYRCAAMQARCCCDSQNALVQKGVLCMHAYAMAVMIHRMLWWKKGVLSLLCMHASAAVMISQNALVEEG
jgi:hypothetical protein